MRFSVIFTILSLFFAMLLHSSTFAFDLDETVDDEIRKNYNDTKLINDTGIKNSAVKKSLNKTKTYEDEDDLPELPTVLKNQPPQASSDIKTSDNTKIKQNETPEITTYIAGENKLKKGITFDVVNSSAISDWQAKGTTVKFTLKKPVHTKSFIIPAWTTFNGEIVERHQPQITCNGGLVAIKVYSMSLRGQTVPINAYIVRANDKKVFFNEIKGSRTYLKTMWKKGNWGRTLFNRMLSLTVKLGADTSTLVLSPFPFAYGTICLGANALVSPITAFFSKGGHVSIPSGSNFKIKLAEDAYIN